MDCLFCSIVSGEIPSKKLYEDEKCVAFYDIDPKAPTHFLVIPKAHIKSVSDVTSADREMTVGHIMNVIAKLTAQLGLDKEGYRVVSNVGDAAGQTVHHLHFHVLGGRLLSWPPG